MRKVCFLDGMTQDEYLKLHPYQRSFVEKIDSEKLSGTRLRPSVSLLDESTLLTADRRSRLVDRVAEFVDENITGRSDMCVQFAHLMAMALCELELPAKIVCGRARYFDDKGREIFRWSHAWVRVNKEVIDGNVDSLGENPMVPTSVSVKPYWGPIDRTPKDRELRAIKHEIATPDTDVTDIWWPDLKTWLASL